MRISLSSDSRDTRLGRYVWFTYEGNRPVEYDDHNPKHSLTLEPGDKFGLAGKGLRTRIVDPADPSIIFWLSEEEATELVKQSKGYSGRIGGVRVKPGVGGLDRSAPAVEPEARVHQRESKKPSSDLYPKIPFPPKSADLLRLYHYFNKRHFAGECPEHAKIQILEASKYLGLATIKLHGDEVSQYKITMAKRGLANTEMVCNILLHEMIHLKHYRRAYELGDLDYMGAMHGPHFIEDMHRLNSLGYNIIVAEKEPSEIILEVPEYVLMMETTDSRWLMFRSESPFLDRLDAIIEAVYAATLVAVDYKRFVYGKTTCSHAYFGIMLTRTHKLPKKRRLRVFDSSSKIITGILSDIKTLREGNLKKEVHADVRPSVVRGAASAVKQIGWSWSVYLSNVMHHAGVLPQKEAKELLQLYYSQPAEVVRIAERFLTPDEIAYARKMWEGIEDRHVLEGAVFAATRKNILKRRLFEKEAAKEIAEDYTAYYQGRVSKERYADLCVRFYGDIMPVLDEDFRSLILATLR